MKNAMKKYWKVFILILFIVTVNSCSNSDSPELNQFSGVWMITFKGNVSTYDISIYIDLDGGSSSEIRFIRQSPYRSYTFWIIPVNVDKTSLVNNSGEVNFLLNNLINIYAGYIKGTFVSSTGSGTWTAFSSIDGFSGSGTWTAIKK